MSNTSIKSWIETVKPVALWILILVIVLQSAWPLFCNFVLYPTGILQSFSRLTGYIVNHVFLTNAIAFLFAGFLLCYIGGLRSKDFALFSKKILPAVWFTIFAWAIIQLSPLAFGYELVVNTTWSEEGMLANKLSRFFTGQIFGNALYEELFFRAMLISQLAILFRKKCSNSKSIIFAIICSQIIFSLMHIPHRIVNDIPVDQMAGNLTALFIAGLLFVTLFSLSNNIFVVVGVHALANASPNIFEHCENQSGIFGIIVIFLLIFTVKWVLRKYSKMRS